MEIKNGKTLKKVEIGDTVYMLPTRNARYWHPHEKYLKGVVTKIGRKYFTVSRGHDGIHKGTEEKFSLDDGQCVTDDNYGYILYGSEEEYFRDAERNEKFLQIRNYFGQSFRKKDPSYDAICKIYEILRGEGLL